MRCLSGRMRAAVVFLVAGLFALSGCNGGSAGKAATTLPDHTQPHATADPSDRAGRAIATICPRASSISVAGISVSPGKSQATGSVGAAGDTKLQCAYDLPAKAGVLTPQIVLLVIDYGQNAETGYELFAKFGECAAPDRDSDPDCEGESYDPMYSQYSRTDQETFAIEMGKPLGSSASIYQASRATRLAGISVAVRSGDYVCATPAVTDPASESPTMLISLAAKVRAAVETMCGA